MVQLGLGLETWSSATAELPLQTVLEAERLGFHSVWSAEAYGADALMPLAFLAAADGAHPPWRPASSRSRRDPPTTAAMCLATLDRLAGGGRVIAGIGLSDPQLVEGWYGQPWGRPLTRLREYVTSCVRPSPARDPSAIAGREYALPVRRCRRDRSARR